MLVFKKKTVCPGLYENLFIHAASSNPVYSSGQAEYLSSVFFSSCQEDPDGVGQFSGVQRPLFYTETHTSLHTQCCVTKITHSTQPGHLRETHRVQLKHFIFNTWNLLF